MSNNDRMIHLGQQLIELSRCGQKCDVTFYKKAPAIDVIIDQKINYALMYGAGPKNYKRCFQALNYQMVIS